MDLVIQKLTKPVLSGNLDQFIDILKELPGEYWEADHFLKDLPGKFQVSCCAFTEVNKLAGYIIASFHDNSGVHIHKFMITGKLRGRHYGQNLLHFFEGIVRDYNLNNITLKVRAENNDAIRFYKREGFEIESECIDSKNSEVLLIMRKLI
jgi:[ribosomal protein S18]-alanine N-acetyltransferase